MNTNAAAATLPRGWSDPLSHTPAEWLEKAADSQRRKQESWERSDSDGFLSQWAHDQMTRQYQSLATLAENGGMAEFPRLADVDGNVIEGARYVEGKYGWSWVHTAADGSTVWFSPSNAKSEETRRARDLAKGYQEIWVSAPAAMDKSGHVVERP